MTIKEKLYNLCVEIITQNIQTLQLSMQSAREAANDDTKSTAGDKHETGRAMMHIEQEKIAKQLNETRLMKDTLSKIDPSAKHTSAQIGSVIYTSKGNFFISVSLGKISTNETDFYAISVQSPIGKNLVGKKKGNSFICNKIEYMIADII